MCDSHCIVYVSSFICLLVTHLDTNLKVACLSAIFIHQRECSMHKALRNCLFERNSNRPDIISIFWHRHIDRFINHIDLEHIVLHVGHKLWSCLDFKFLCGLEGWVVSLHIVRSFLKSIEIIAKEGQHSAVLSAANATDR